jgi:hypothetical protein
MSTEPFWYDDPNVLFSRAKWYVFVPQATMTVKEALNAVVRFSAYLSVLLAATSRDVWYLLLIPLVMVVTIFLEKWFPKAKKISEGFQSGPVVSGYSGTDTTMPSDDNPFMNPQLTEIHSENERPPAADVTDIKVRDKVNEAFAQTSNLYMDTSDVFDLVQSQRNFYTVPEDDHAGFLAFLGKNAQQTNQKLLSEGFVVAKGTFRELPTASVSSAPEGTAPANA